MEAATSTTTCYRHKDRETGVSCSSCGRPICPECMTPTPVGMRCPECSKQTTQVRSVASIAGGTSTVAPVIIAICLVAFAAELATANLSIEQSVLGRGALFGPLIAEGEIWRIVTSGFLHSDGIPLGFLHIAFNMYFLYILGQMLEPVVGRVRFVVMFFVSLLGGSFGALLLSPNVLTVGASGAVFGLLGAAIMHLRSRGIAPMSTPLGSILLFNLVITFGFAGRISVGGHLGGLIAGGLAGYLLFEVGRRRERRTPALAACVALGVLAFAGSLVVA